MDILFGFVLVVRVLAIYDRLKNTSLVLSGSATAVGLIWAVWHHPNCVVRLVGSGAAAAQPGCSIK